MCTFNHFIQAPNVYSHGQMALEYMDRGYHKAIEGRTVTERGALCTGPACVWENTAFSHIKAV